MKTALFILSFSVASFTTSLASADTTIPQDKCEEIAIDSSIVDFSPDTSGNWPIFEQMGLGNKTGVAFIEQTRLELMNKMKNLCKENGITLERIQKVHHNECSSACQKFSGIHYKKPLFGENTKKLNADTACLMVCNRSRVRLDSLIQGAALGKLEKTQVADCSGAVSNSKREMKATILDGALERERTFYDTKNK